MQEFQLFIDGVSRGGATGESFATINPFDQKEWARIAQATKEDVDEAVAAARRAFRLWRALSGHARGQLMARLADLTDAEAERLGTYETQDNGKLHAESIKNVTAASRYYRFFGSYADKIRSEVIPMDNPDLFDYTLREPIGVIAIVTPWNAPLSILANALAPALAAGNTVVIKPSEYTSVTTLEFARIAEKAGFPKGVINVVAGGRDVGDWLASHPGIGKIAFTGGAPTARAIARNAAANLVPLMLELGGKSPNIIFADTDLDKAIASASAGVFGGAGQTCIAGSRLLVQRTVYDDVVARLARRADAIRLGDPMDPATRMGPIAHKAHFERILNMLDTARSEGATAATGPAREPLADNAAGGLFIAPTVLTGVSNGNLIAREEVFGPVIAAIPFDDDDEALAIANDTEYGLAAGVWTRDIRRAHRMAREIEAGQVWINTYRISGAQVPFGGYKRSGYGRARGYESLLEYTQIKNVMIDLA